MNPTLDPNLAYGLLRIAAIAPELQVTDISFNKGKILEAMRTASQRGASLAIFPELCLTGYTCGDLFTHRLLHVRAKEALESLADATKALNIHAVVGLPIPLQGRLYNCAAVIGSGRVIGLVPKQFLPSTGEYYEKRWFTSGANLQPTTVDFDDYAAPFATDLIFRDEKAGCAFGLEICEDLWAVQPPSGRLSLAGANLVFNLSASSELIGKASYRRELVRQQSARCNVAYVYSSAGPGESTTDVVFAGHCLIVENGAILAESSRYQFSTQLVFADIDLEHLQHERLRNSSFSSSAPAGDTRNIQVTLQAASTSEPLGSLRPNPQLPFLPGDPRIRSETCGEIFSIQSTGLAKRLRHTGATNVVLGISGGLDSTLALLVTVQTFDLLGLDRKGILAITMPGFGTTSRTRGNAGKLIEHLGATFRVIPINAAVEQHFKDIGHAEGVYDITYENAQARERTQILMDVANQAGGFVVGTGDLSEAALGWCTFNGDHMSMYHVNAGVPKTLVRYLIDWCADTVFAGPTGEVLHEIAATPISPELLPLTHDGAQPQQTEDTVGPYELHDYFLYHFLRHGTRPAKVLYFAEIAFAGRYEKAILLKWLEVFCRRFFSQQFKRSAMPDGPKIGSVALSPRGDWRMPSDASAREWLAEIATLRDKASPLAD